jgi:phage-related minor tail protein
MAEFDNLEAHDATAAASELNGAIDGLSVRTDALIVRTNSFAGAMTRAFTSASAGGRAFDDVLKSLALRISSLAVADAFKPLALGITGGLNSLFAGLFGGAGGPVGLAAAMGAIKPFAAGGVIGTPTYFPLAQGGLGLAGEAGPEAIMPLARGRDGRLGVAASAGSPANVTVQIMTPDPATFRRSEAYLSGQIARAVARGQRSL